MSITLITGPVNSGKSTKLCSKIAISCMSKKKTLILQHTNSKTSSYVRETAKTHNASFTLSTTKIMNNSDITSIIQELKQYEHVYIDEGQFFHDIGKCARELANSGVHVTIAMLNSSFDGKPWKCIEEMGPCEKIIQLKSVCDKCKKYNAIYSFKLGNSKKLVDTESAYVPLCRRCYNECSYTSTTTKESIPEPSPVNRGEIVSDALIQWIESNIKDGKEECIKLIKERDQFGRKKYGQPLMTQDGRNTIEDLRQELGDAMQYAMKAKINKEDLSSMLAYYYALRKLLKE